jgi:hypothetical protein
MAIIPPANPTTSAAETISLTPSWKSLVISEFFFPAGSLPYNDPNLVYPIPAREIAANPVIAEQQNEGY